MTQKLLCLGALLAAALGAQSCAKSGCIGKGPGCKVEPPCPKVSFTCASTQLEAFQIDGASPPPARPAPTRSRPTATSCSRTPSPPW